MLSRYSENKLIELFGSVLFSRDIRSLCENETKGIITMHKERLSRQAVCLHQALGEDSSCCSDF